MYPCEIQIERSVIKKQRRVLSERLTPPEKQNRGKKEIKTMKTKSVMINVAMITEKRVTVVIAKIEVIKNQAI